MDAVPAFWRHLDGLYRQVHARSLELNTFPLPEGFFRAVLHYPECELLLLRERGAEEALPVAVIAAFRAPGRYCPLVLGMDYRLVRDQGLYRQCLRATLTRARALGATSLELGMGAGLQKRRLGALAREGAVFIQAEDHYALDVLAQVKAELGVGSA